MFTRSSIAIAAALAFAALTGCQTVEHARFDDIRIGMSKSAVVNLAGGPNWSGRIQGKDRWVYINHNRYEPDLIREVQFEAGHVVYFGPRVKPSVSASEQDEKNEAHSAREDETEKREVEKRDQVMGVAHVQTADEKSHPDDLDLKIRDSLYGTQSYKESGREKNKTAPDFVPVE